MIEIDETSISAFEFKNIIYEPFIITIVFKNIPEIDFETEYQVKYNRLIVICKIQSYSNNTIIFTHPFAIDNLQYTRLFSNTSFKNIVSEIYNQININNLLSKTYYFIIQYKRTNINFITYISKISKCILIFNFDSTISIINSNKEIKIQNLEYLIQMRQFYKYEFKNIYEYDVHKVANIEHNKHLEKEKKIYTEIQFSVIDILNLYDYIIYKDKKYFIISVIYDFNKKIFNYTCISYILFDIEEQNSYIDRAFVIDSSVYKHHIYTETWFNKKTPVRFSLIRADTKAQASILPTKGAEVIIMIKSIYEIIMLGVYSNSTYDYNIIKELETSNGYDFKNENFKIRITSGKMEYDIKDGDIKQESENHNITTKKQFTVISDEMIIKVKNKIKIDCDSFELNAKETKIVSKNTQIKCNNDMKIEATNINQEASADIQQKCLNLNSKATNQVKVESMQCEIKTSIKFKISSITIEIKGINLNIEGAILNIKGAIVKIQAAMINTQGILMLSGLFTCATVAISGLINGHP